MSIRRRTATLVASSFVVLLVAGGAVLYTVLRGALTSQFDEGLTARAEALRSLTRFDGTKVEIDFTGEAMPRFGQQRGGEAEYFIVWVREAGTGMWRALERSESLGSQAWPAADALAEGTADLPLPSGSRGRAVVTEFVPAREHDEEAEQSGEARRPEQTVPAPRVRILVAAPRRPLDHAMAAVSWSIAGVGSALALAAVLASRWGIRRGLSPLNDLSRRVGAIGPTSLDARLDDAPLPAELRPIAEQLTALFARLREAIERERRFSAAASHELRTPIAELRTLMEVSASRPRTDAEWRVTSEKAVAVLDRAQSLSESLLRLARAQHADSPPASGPPVRLAPVLAESAARALALHGGDPRRLRVECDADLTVAADTEALALVIGNLLDNALRHGQVTAEQPARCTARVIDERLQIIVSNVAANLTASDLPRLGEPFWQAEASRTTGRGFGLGLAICRALIERSGGTMTATRADDGSLEMCLDLDAGGRD